MSLSIRNNSMNGELLEKVITNNDLSGLSSLEKVQYIKNVCESLGLNPLTKPIQLLKFQGKEIAYFTKDSTEQLRKNNNISIKIRDTKITEGIYIVIVDAKTPDGREDSSTGATTIAGLKGNDLCNAMLKAETKAKRRVTLSICGLGFTDESEIETMNGARKIDIHKPIELINPIKIESRDIQQDILDVSWADTKEELQEIFTISYKHWVSLKDKESLSKLIEAKDKRKNELEVKQFQDELDTVDVETGEVKND